ncbi:amidohydrolase [Pseudooceanicola sediminis]|uniref:Amidohydrolase n=1 Tax=Pseudooceanicola sediminis TaxID=2211117 RepID=A0A399J2D6_9RHOB|nr:nitrilase-related carbon-nitrogen hydrolase [Pseudooceanicola sediminis]KAA2317214.1 amidohydrolase [Puniceibacterium sp. HSS470]RII39568.1 amidohydrolase [Pseudooceanicola sediminis]|tara:strand:- start:8832 stop:9851 length:1020 start_codon:yes stop_codon:yes gene_type:complete
MAIQPWRATCIQMTSKIACNATTKDAAWDIINANIANALSKIRAACEGPNPPKLVVLPEFVFQGPQRGTPASQWIERACATIPGPITETLADLCREFDIYIAGNHFEVDPKWPDRYFNSSFLLDPSGEVILRYRRINTGSWTSPHDILDEYRDAYGEDGIFPVADTPLGRLAIYPCGEVNVPEITRVFMLRGAEVILHPNNEPLTPIADMAKQCRAAENMMYLVSTNLAGTAGFSDTLTGGHSMIVDYRGTRIAFEETAEETVACSAMIDVEALRDARKDLGMGNSILRGRFAMYRDYYGKAEVYPANGLAEKAVESNDDFAPVQKIALDNLTKAGIVR